MLDSRTDGDRANLHELAANLRLVVLDVDGVMTDGGIILIGESEEAKRFDVQDGLGINLLHLMGLQVAIISGRESQVTTRRAQELGISAIYQGIKDKQEALRLLLERLEIPIKQVAYIGDDLPDIPVMQQVGLAIAVQNARPEVKRYAAYVTQAFGGHGAIREAVEWLIDLQNKRAEIFAKWGIEA